MVIELNSFLLEQNLATKSVIVIDFYASWCGPCMNMKPIFHKIAEEFQNKAIFGQVNVDDQRSLAIEYKISSIPTIICIKDGAVVWFHTGTISEQILKEKISLII